jgi:hypothetical protein
MSICTLHDPFAEVDSDAEFDALILGLAGISLGHSALDSDRALDGTDATCRFVPTLARWLGPTRSRSRHGEGCGVISFGGQIALGCASVNERRNHPSD